MLVEEMAPKSSKIGKGFNTVTVVADQIGRSGRSAGGILVTKSVGST